MLDPNKKPENALAKRLKNIFRRDKKAEKKPKAELTSQDLNKRAFNMSLITGIFFLVITIIQIVTYVSAGKELPLNSAPMLGALITLACFISVFLTRIGKATFGLVLILFSLYTALLVSASITSGGGVVSAAFAIGITSAITATAMTPKVAKRINLIPIVVSVIPISLDLFEPYMRQKDPSPQGTAVISAIMIIVFAVVLLRRFNTYNLRAKLLISFAVVTILPLIALIFYTGARLNDELYKNKQAELAQFFNQIASQVDAFLENRISAIKVDSQSPLFIEYLSLAPQQRPASKIESDVKNTLTILANQDKTFIRAYTLLDEKGSTVLSTTNAPTQNTYLAQISKQTLLKQQALVTGPLIDQKTGAASLYFSAPVQKLGVLVITYDANIIESVVEKIIPANASDGLLFRVVDKTNFVRIADTSTAHPELRYTSFKDLTPSQVSELQKQGILPPQNTLAKDTETVTALENLGKSVFFTTLADKTLQTQYLNSGTQLKTMPWIAIAQQSDSAVSIPLVEQRRITTVIFIILIALITLAAFGLSQLLASPILNLASTAQKIAAGDLTLQSDIESNDEIGTLATSFNQMTRQTRTLINSLEQRSKALATSSEVSRRISTILDQQELVTEVVKQVQMAFGYYHAHIYLLDENTQELIMAGGTGEAGKAMLARNHKIPMGKGLVGRAAQNNITVLVTNVAEEPQWLPNPLLPDTKSEVAVPIAIAERVLGVLDVQHNVADTLKQEDVDVLQSIANQVAFAVRNARSYSEVQAKADRESLISSIGQKIQGTITVESAMQVAIREIGRALNGAKTQVTLNENSTTDHIHNDEGSILEPEN